MKLFEILGSLSRFFHHISGGYFLSVLLKNFYNFIRKNQPEFISYKFKGIVFNVYPNTDLGNKMFWRGAHSWPPIFILQKEIKEGYVCLDIGANQGEYTLWMSKLTGSKGEVHSFEPSKKMVNLLKLNLEKNQNFSFNVYVHAYGLSNEDNWVNLYLPEIDSTKINEGAASLFKMSGEDKIIEKIQILHSGKALKAVVKRKIDFIKIDIEGSEMKVLNGMEEILKSDTPKILIEINKKALLNAGSSPLEVANFLVKIGYKFYQIKQRGKLTPTNIDEFDNFVDVNILAIVST